MKVGLFLPISGRAAGPETLRESAQMAETLGFNSVWTADRIIIPWEIKTRYPYGKDDHFFVPPDRPFPNGWRKSNGSVKKYYRH